MKKLIITSLREALRTFLQIAQKAWLLGKRTVQNLPPRRIAEETFLLLLFVQIAVLSINVINAHRPILGLRFDGHVVGKLEGNFQEQIDAIVNTNENALIPIVAAGYKGEISFAQLGEHTNKPQLYASLLKEGRAGNATQRLAVQNVAFFNGRDIPINHDTFNSKLVHAYVASIDKQIDTAPTNAYFTLVNNQVTVRPDIAGIAVDTEAAINTIHACDFHP